MGYRSVGKTSLLSMRIASWTKEEERVAPRREMRRHARDDDEEGALNVETLHEVLNNMSVRMDAMVERFTAQFDDMSHQIEQWRDKVNPICRLVCEFFAENPDLVPGSIGRTTLQNMNTVHEDDTLYRLNPLRDEAGEALEREMVRWAEGDAREVSNVKNLEEHIYDLFRRPKCPERPFLGVTK